MITSMTGYGQCELTQGDLTVSVELRSVNNRFLEISLRAPRELNNREGEIREIVRGILSRGKINLNISVDRQAGAAGAVQLDEDRLKAYVTVLERIRQTAGIEDPLRMSSVLHFADDFIHSGDDEKSDEVLWTLVSEAVRTATKSLEQMRNDEGKELQSDILARITAIDALVDQIEPVAKARIPLERDRLRERVAELIDPERLDQARLEFELTMIADKYDITEEVVRYRSHSKYFVDAVNGPEPAGRKLGFLLQEINREVTTIASKTSNAGVSQLIVGAKEELEKIREQVQNIE